MMWRCTTRLRGAALIGVVACSSGKQTIARQIDAGHIPGDVLTPVPGGPGYFGRWPHGPPSDPSFFLLTVWLQNPMNVDRFKEVGINFFTGLNQGPTDGQLAELAAAGLPVICEQGGVWQSHLQEPTIR